MQPRAIVGDLLFDGAALVREPFRIELCNGEIAAVHLGARPIDGDDAIDARGALVLPGIINAHAHVPRAGYIEPTEPIGIRQPIRNLRDSLAAGVTTVADMGCPAPMIRALRSLTDRDALAGPSIRGAGPLITAPRGYPLDWMPKLFVRMGAALACDDEREAALAVGRVAAAGMDHVKLAIMHQSYGAAPLPALREPVAAAAVREAHRLGLRALAHAHSNEDYRVALAAGVDALMHSSFEPLTSDLLRQIVDAGIAVCPTLWVFESTCFAAERHLDADAALGAAVERGVRRSWKRFVDAWQVSGDVVPEGIGSGLSKERGREAVRVAAANLRLLVEAGVPIAFGNDANYGFSILSRPVDELRTMQRAGMDPMSCLRAATLGAAELLGLRDRGRVRAGFRADLLVVPSEVTADVERIESVSRVIRSGVLVEGSSLAADARRGAAYARGVVSTLEASFLRG